MSETPEKDKLQEYLFGEESRKLVNFHVSWGPNAHLLSVEERYAAINRALEQAGDVVENVDEYDSRKSRKAPESKQEKVNVEDWLKRMTEAFEAGKSAFATGGKNTYPEGSQEHTNFQRGYAHCRVNWIRDGQTDNSL